MWCRLQCKECHTYAEYAFINTECCDVILSGYYVLNTGVWYHRYTGCDTIHIVAVMSSIEWVWWHRYSGPEVRYSVVVVIHNVMWCPKELMWCHIEEYWCHECSVRDVLEHDHWCHKVWIWCDVDRVWYHTQSNPIRAPSVMTYTLVVISSILWYIDTDVSAICDMTQILWLWCQNGGEMSGIVVVLSWKQYGDSIHIVYDIINILGVMLYIEGYNVINSCCYSMHREYDVTRIVWAMSYREWYGITDTLGLMTQIQWM